MNKIEAENLILLGNSIFLEKIHSVQNDGKTFFILKIVKKSKYKPSGCNAGIYCIISVIGNLNQSLIHVCRGELMSVFILCCFEIGL